MFRRRRDAARLGRDREEVSTKLPLSGRGIFDPHATRQQRSCWKAGEIPDVVVEFGAERIRPFGMRADQVTDLVHENAAAKRRAPARKRHRVDVQAPGTVYGERPEAFGCNRAGREQRVSEVWSVFGSHQPRRRE